MASEKFRVLVWTFNEVASPLGTVEVKINGRHAGVSDKLGRFYTELQPGRYRVEAYIPGFQRAVKTVEIKQIPVTTHVEMLLNRPDVDIYVSSISANMQLPADFSNMEIELRRRDGTPLVIERVDYIYLTDMNKSVTKDIQDYFLLRNGKLWLDQASEISLRDLFQGLRSMGRINIRAAVKGFERPVIDTERFFYIGRYKLKLALKNHKGQRLGSETLRIEYRPIKIKPTVPGIVYRIEAKNGSLFLDDLPFGHYRISRESGTFHKNSLWDWNFVMLGDVEIDLHPNSRSDFRTKLPNLKYVKHNQDPRFAVINFLRRVE